MIGLACGGRINFVSSLLGYASLGWLIWLLFARFDHYGRVCMGNGISDSGSFPNLQRLGNYTIFYLGIIGVCVASLFIFVLIYSCCVDSSPKIDKKDDDKQE
jgi:hypothetical protein